MATSKRAMILRGLRDQLGGVEEALKDPALTRASRQDFTTAAEYLVEMIEDWTLPKAYESVFQCRDCGTFVEDSIEAWEHYGQGLCVNQFDLVEPELTYHDDTILGPVPGSTQVHEAIEQLLAAHRCTDGHEGAYHEEL